MFRHCKTGGLYCGEMRPVFARGNSKTAGFLLHLRQEASRDDEPRVAQRFHAIALSIEGHTASQIARALKVHRSSVPLWIRQWNAQGEVGLLEGRRFRQACRSECSTRETVARHPGQRSGGLRIGKRDLDFSSHPQRDGPRVWRRLSSRPRSQAGQALGLLCSTACHSTGQRESGAEKSLGALHKSEA